jgi:hypothetical protein
VDGIPCIRPRQRRPVDPYDNGRAHDGIKLAHATAHQHQLPCNGVRMAWGEQTSLALVPRHTCIVYRSFGSSFACVTLACVISLGATSQMPEDPFRVMLCMHSRLGTIFLSHTLPGVKLRPAPVVLGKLRLRATKN